MQQAGPARHLAILPKEGTGTETRAKGGRADIIIVVYIETGSVYSHRFVDARAVPGPSLQAARL